MTRRSFFLAALLPAFGFVPSNLVVEQHVDVVELNHFLDGQAKLIFDQAVWWEYIWWIEEYRVVDWRIDHEAHPRYDHRGDRWVSFWRDKKDNCYRRVYATGHRESWTQYDVEVEDRANLPCHLRTGLLNVRTA